MRIGLALEGLLVDVESQFNTWKSRWGEASSYLDPRVIRDESFWASLKPHCNGEVLENHEVFILTPRPPSLFLITRSWLGRNGFNIADDHIILRSSGLIKRYDCRIYDIDYYVDSDVEVLSSFRYDRCIPIGVGAGFPEWIRTFESVEQIKFEEDLRNWKIYEKM